MQFKFLGFDIRLDFTFLFIGILFYGLFTTIGLVLFLLVSGLTVLLHELGHAITARRVGGDVLSVNLQGFGGFTAWLPNDGVTVMERFWVAAAGPLYQLALGALFYALIYAGALGSRLSDVLGSPLNWTALWVADREGQWLEFVVLAMAILSVVWAVFNLVPIFGLDGYTMLRQLMVRVSPTRGDDVARVLGLIISVGLVGFFALRGAILGAVWVGYIAFSNYASATRREPIQPKPTRESRLEAGAGEYWPYEPFESESAPESLPGEGPSEPPVSPDSD